jgi:hypothetical protein
LATFTEEEKDFLQRLMSIYDEDEEEDEEYEEES